MDGMGLVRIVGWYDKVIFVRNLSTVKADLSLCRGHVGVMTVLDTNSSYLINKEFTHNNLKIKCNKGSSCQ